MDLSIQIKLNNKLFLRNPEDTELGRDLLKYSIVLIHRMGIEAFTFKKLADEIGTTEASVYRYFENKHLLLVYLVSWYWTWLEYQIIIQTNNIKQPRQRLKKMIQIIGSHVIDDQTTVHIDEYLLYEIVMSEGIKAYLTKHVKSDNTHQFFKPYKDLCNRIAEVMLLCNPKYKYPHSLTSTLIESAHIQNYFKRNLPSLTDFDQANEDDTLIHFLQDLVFGALA